MVSMVVGYNCTESCGYQAECDVGESGERLCPECGMAVLGITGDLRPMTNEFRVMYGAGGTGYSDGGIRVNAAGVAEAFEQAQDSVPEGKVITEIQTVRD